MRSFPSRLLVAGLCAFMLSAHSGATGVVKERMELMKGLSISNTLLKSMVRGEIPWNQAAAREHAGTIYLLSADALTKLFPEDSLQAPTEALPAIWRNWTEFQEIAGETRYWAQVLYWSLEKDTRGPSDETTKALSRLSRTCKTCHIDYRQEKQ